jgi:hypothetical protein
MDLSQPFPNIPVLHVEVPGIYIFLSPASVFFKLETTWMNFFFPSSFCNCTTSKENQLTPLNRILTSVREAFWSKIEDGYDVRASVLLGYPSRLCFQRFFLLDWIVSGRFIFSSHSYGFSVDFCGLSTVTEARALIRGDSGTDSC